MNKIIFLFLVYILPVFFDTRIVYVSRILGYVLDFYGRVWFIFLVPEQHRLRD